MIVLALLAACDSEPDAPEGSEAYAAEAAAEALLEQAPVPPPSPSPSAEAEADEGAQIAELAQVVLVWEGISGLYKGFFSDRDAVTELAEGLGPWLESPVDVTIRYNAEDSVGDILVKLRPGQLRQPVSVDGDTIDLQGLAPVTVALAAYRSSIASRFDFRVESFRVSLESYRGARVCQLTLAGAPPPDGRLISPCVQINGQGICGQPTQEGVVFPSQSAADLAVCLDR